MIDALTSPQNLSALWATVSTGALAAVVAAVIGIPMSILVERTDVRGRNALGALLALPLAIPPYLLAFAWRAAYDDRIGLLSFVGRTVGDVDSKGGIALVLGTAFLPIVVLRLRATLSSIDGALEEAARTAGASPLRALVDVTVPLVLPAALSSTALVFVASIAAYGVPVLLGLQADPPVVVVTARIAAALQGGDTSSLRDAMAMSTALAALAGVAFAVPALLSRGRATVTGKASRPTTLSLSALRTPLSALCWLTVTAAIALPLCTLLLQGVLLRAGRGIAVDNVSLHHLRDVLMRHEVVQAAQASLMLAVASALIITIVSVTIVVAKRRLPRMASRLMAGLMALLETAYALPGTILAVLLVMTFSTSLRVIVLERVTFILAVSGTLWLLLIAYVIKHAALGLRAADQALDQLHPSLEEAARIAGASPLRAFVDVTLPLLRAHLIAAAVAVALPCFTELTMSVLLQAPGTQTLGVVLFSLYEYGDPQEAMALAGVLVVTALVGQLVIWLLRRRA